MNFAGLLAESYSLWSTKAENDLSVNCWRERIQSGQGVNEHYLRRSPGISPQISGGAGCVRGMFDASVNGEERLWSAIGGSLYESPDGVTQATKGLIGNDGGFVQFAASQTSVLLVSDGKLFRLNSGTLSEVSLSFVPIGVVFIKNYFVVLSSNMQQFYWDDFDDGATFPADHVQTAEADANDVLGIQVLNQQLWLIGNRITQIFYVGGNPNAPFVPNDSGVIRSGTVSAATVRLLGDALIWLDRTAEGQGCVVMTEGYAVRTVSNFYIDNAIENLSKTNDLGDSTALSFEIAGHAFYRFTVGDRTFEYHKTQNEWEEVSWLNWLLGTQHKHRGYSACQAFGKTLIGDHSNGLIYDLAVDTYHDYGFPMRWNRRAPHIVEENKNIQYPRLNLGMETGVGLQEPLWLNNYSLDEAAFITALAAAVSGGSVTADQALTLQKIYDFLPYIPLDPYPTPQTMSDLGFFPWGAQSALDDGTIIGTPPQIVMRYSNDGGNSYANELPRSMGLAGQNRHKVYWNRLGMTEDRVFDFFSTDPTKLAITAGWFPIDPEVMAH